MIIERNKISAIRNLPSGTFAIPNLEWSLEPGGLSEISGEGPRSMITMLIKRGFKEHITNLLAENVLQNLQDFGTQTFNELERVILDRIEEYVSRIKSGRQISDAEITTIVCGIHIWGGRTGRNLFVMGNKFPGNFSFPDYRKMISAILEPNEQRAIEALQLGNFSQFGTAYATKHLAFWTKSPQVGIKLPIFDSIINRIVFGENGTPSFRNYTHYLSRMKQAASQINQLNPTFQGQYHVHHLERQLFDWNNTEPSLCKQWQKIRTGER
jgi:hypothetical protein